MRVTHLQLRFGGGAVRAAPVTGAWVLLGPAICAPAWRPPCDVVEGAAEWTARIEIGGVADDDVEISVYEDSLVVEGVRPWPGASAGDRVHLAEVRYGAFRLELELPEGIDRDGASARLDRGLLTVSLPRARSALP